jgi:SAM-dependent methyltransferase
VTVTGDLGYGRQFADFYDRLFPPGAEANRTADRLAALHPGGGLPSLELGVGTGRIALPLSDRAGAVVGIDSSPEMLAVLRAALEAEPRPVTPVHGDVREYADGERYGLVYCVCGTVSMLLTEAEQRQVLVRCADALAPGGVVVIETHNPAFVARLHGDRTRESFFTPYPGPDTGLLSYSVLDPGGALWRLSHLWFEDGRVRIASESSRLTTPAEIDAYAAAAGLRPAGRYGDWDGTPFAGAEPAAVCVYRGPGGQG